MSGFVKAMDRLSAWAGVLAGVLFCVIGGFVCFEVAARYLFNDPTIWAEELSRLLQVWAVYAAAAFVLKDRRLIYIDVFQRKMGPRAKLAQQTLVLLIILTFSLIAIFWSLRILEDSLRLGRASSTMLGTPAWLFELPIALGFLLLALQALAELIRLYREGPRDGAGHGDLA